MSKLATQLCGLSGSSMMKSRPKKKCPSKIKRKENSTGGGGGSSSQSISGDNYKVTLQVLICSRVLPVI